MYGNLLTLTMVLAVAGAGGPLRAVSHEPGARVRAAGMSFDRKRLRPLTRNERPLGDQEESLQNQRAGNKKGRRLGRPFQAFESQRSGLNRRPLDYESSALPLSYAGEVRAELLICCECPDADSNRDAFRHSLLKTACLPVSPPGP